MGRNPQSKCGGYVGNKGNKTYASGGRGGGGNKTSVDAATALELGAQPQNTMLLGMAGLGMVQQNPLNALFRICGDERYDRTERLGRSQLTVCE